MIARKPLKTRENKSRCSYRACAGGRRSSRLLAIHLQPGVHQYDDLIEHLGLHALLRRDHLDQAIRGMVAKVPHLVLSFNTFAFVDFL